MGQEAKAQESTVNNSGNSNEAKASSNTFTFFQFPKVSNATSGQKTDEKDAGNSLLGKNGRPALVEDDYFAPTDQQKSNTFDFRNSTLSTQYTSNPFVSKKSKTAEGESRKTDQGHKSEEKGTKHSSELLESLSGGKSKT